MFICMINSIMLMINKARVDFLFEIPMCPSELVGGLCLTVRIQSVLNVCCKAEPNLTTRLETDSDSGKQREHLSLSCL